MKDVQYEEDKGKISFSAQRGSTNIQGADNHRFKSQIRSEITDTLLAKYRSLGIIRSQKLLIMLDYYPARLVKSQDRWYFSFYQTSPITGKRERHRETFNIGRIPIQDRVRVAREIIKRINSQLPYGYPWNEEFYSREVIMTTSSAFKLVKSLGSDLRPATIISYASSMRKFEAFIKKINLHKESVTTITRKVAMAYSDHLVSIGLSGRSHNNDINEMRRVFNILKTREIVSVNPFDGVPKRRVAEKTRRGLEHHEIKIIMEYLQQVDKSTYLSCAILYFCFIRPNEQRYIKRCDINLEDSIIIIHGSHAKNRKTAFVTIPDQLKEIFVSVGINELSPDEYIIGSSNKIGKNTPVGKSSISNRYREAIQELHKKKLLSSITGNTLYSWKDTGADALGRSGVNGIAFRDQLRHHSLNESQTYLGRPRGANDYIKENHRLNI